jgi:hypothetical protein
MYSVYFGLSSMDPDGLFDIGGMIGGLVANFSPPEGKGCVSASLHLTTALPIAGFRFSQDVYPVRALGNAVVGFIKKYEVSVDLDFQICLTSKCPPCITVTLKVKSEFPLTAAPILGMTIKGFVEGGGTMTFCGTPPVLKSGDIFICAGMKATSEFDVLVANAKGFAQVKMCCSMAKGCATYFDWGIELKTKGFLWDSKYQYGGTNCVGPACSNNYWE